MSGEAMATVVIIVGACIAGGAFGAQAAKKKWERNVSKKFFDEERANDRFANIKTPDRTALKKEAQEFEEYIRQKRATQLKGEDESVPLDDDATNVGKKNQQSSENLCCRNNTMHCSE